MKEEEEVERWSDSGRERTGTVEEKITSFSTRKKFHASQ